MRKQKPDLLPTLKPRLQPPCAHWALESDVEMDVRVKTSMTFPSTMIGSPSAIPGVHSDITRQPELAGLLPLSLALRLHHRPRRPSASSTTQSVCRR